MVARRGAFVNPSNTSEELRLAQAGLVVRNLDRSIRVGVLGGQGSANLVSARSTMSVNVAAFSAVVSRSAAYGVVVVTNDGSDVVTLSAAPSSNSRIDVVWVRQKDTTQGDADSNAELGATAGTAAASPVKPSIPAGALELATVLIPAGVTGTTAGSVVITQTHPFTAAAGGVVQVRNAVEENAFPAASGQIIHRLDTGLSKGRANGAWNPFGEQVQSRQFSIARSVPAGSSALPMLLSAEVDSTRTFPYFPMSFNAGTWWLSTPGWYLVSATVGISLASGGANGGSGALLRIMAGSSDIASSPYGGTRSTTVTTPVYSDGSFQFVVEGYHNQGSSARDMTGSLRILRLGGLG